MDFKSLKEKFIDRLKDMIEDQQRMVESLRHELSENSKTIVKLAAQIIDLGQKDRDILQDIDEEAYILEKFNEILQLNLQGTPENE